MAYDSVGGGPYLLAFSDLVRFCCNILNITKKKGLTRGRPLSRTQRMTAMEIEPAVDSGRNRGSDCSGQGTATQMFKIIRGLSNILNITKENRGRNSGRTEAAVATEGAGGSNLRLH